MNDDELLQASENAKKISRIDLLKLFRELTELCKKAKEAIRNVKK